MLEINTIPPVLTSQEILMFHSYVNKEQGQGPNGDCWEWTRVKNEKNYGKFTGRDNRSYRTHRLAFYLSTGIWSKLLIRHSCDNPPCCNPVHLIEGSPRNNTDDAMQRGRIVRGNRHCCAKLTEDIVRIIRSRCASGTHTHHELAKEYGVARSIITRAVLRYTWKHI